MGSNNLWDEFKAVYNYNKNGYEVYCQNCKHLNSCLEKGLIVKQDAEPFLYNNAKVHYWDEHGNSCIFKDKQEYENS